MSDNQINNTDNTSNDDNMVVDPWKVSGTIDYMKLINKFGTHPIDGKLIQRWEKVTGRPAHFWLRRGLFFSQQDMEIVLNQRDAGKQVYLYTGRGPSSESMHLGHLVPFIFTKYLQDALDAILIIQMSDDEKFFFKGGNLDEYLRLTYENAKDIIACGFNSHKTFIFSNLQMMGGDLYYNNVLIMQATTGNQIRGIYGLNLDNNIGQLVWPAFQSAPAFSTSFRDIFGNEPIQCLVAMAIDQSPYFRMARDIAYKLNSPKPAVIHSRFLPGLQGPKGKMSSTATAGATVNATLFLNMNRKQIKDVIMKYAFSGGRETKELHQQLGGDVSIDVCYQYLCYFLESDQELEKIAKDYSNGDMLTGQLKQFTANIIADVIIKHQEAKALISQELLNYFFDRSKFKNSLPQTTHEPIFSNYTDYDKYGINFDLTFGYKPKGI